MAKPHLTEEQCHLIEGLLRYHLPKNTEIWVFSSRTTAAHKPFSDLDLFMKSAFPINKKNLAACEYALEVSSFPYKVDLLNWSCISIEFRQLIEENSHFLWFTV